LKQKKVSIENGRKLLFPLPTVTDNQIKKIVIKSLGTNFAPGSFHKIESSRLSELLATIKKNSQQVGLHFSVDQILKCLVKLEYVDAYLKKMNQRIWYSLPWILQVDFGIIDYDFYKLLNTDGDQDS